MKIFLSYPSERLEDAKTVYRFVRSVDLECWWDKENLIGGQDWNRERRDAQAAADIIILICSEETTGRNGVIQREINEALDASRDRRPDQIYVVPLRTAAIDLPTEITRYQYIDIFQSGWRTKLAITLKKALEQRGLVASSKLKVAASTSVSGNKTDVLCEEKDDHGDRSVSFFRYDEEGEYWDYVNSEITSIAIGGYYESRRHMLDWGSALGESYWELGITEFHRFGELISLVVGCSSYFSGAAHPNHAVTTMNIFGPHCGKICIRDLFEDSRKALTILKEYSEFDLKRQSIESSSEAVSILDYVETYEWHLFENFNVNERGMVIHFSAASGIPHALGVFDIYIPWEGVSSFLPSSVRTFLRACNMPIGPQ